MAIENIGLYKLLRLMYLTGAPRRRELRQDIRNDRTRGTKGAPEPRDFYVPFWAAAKHHTTGGTDLHESVDDLISRNYVNRRNLYPLLRDGFLLWWDERRRWTNEPFTPGTSLKKTLKFEELNAEVRINNILSVRDGQGVEHFIYPYFAQEPILTEEAARIGLWVLGKAFPEIPHEELRLLDVMRGQTYSVDRNPMQGNEAELFKRNYIQLISDRDALSGD